MAGKRIRRYKSGMVYYSKQVIVIYPQDLSNFRAGSNGDSTSEKEQRDVQKYV